MRIAVFDNLPDGGAKRVVFEQVKGLSEKHEVTYYHNESDETGFSFSRVAGATNGYPLDLVNYSRWKRPVQELGLYTKILPTYEQMAKDMDDSSFDVVLVHPCRITQAPFLLSKLKTPSVYYAEEWLRMIYEPELHLFEGQVWYKSIYEQYRRKFIGRIDLVNARSSSRLVGNSRYTLDHLKQAYGRGDDYIYPGVDVDIFKPKEGYSKDYFLFIGEEDAVHGFPLIESVKRADRKAKIITVSFKGGGFSVSDEKLVDLYQNAVATLCLDINEPFGMVAVESMACGTPVIAIDEGGYKETVVEGKTGFLITRESKELLSKMMLVGKDQKLRESMGKASRKHVIEHFTWKDHVGKLEKILGGVVDD